MRSFYSHEKGKPRYAVFDIHALRDIAVMSVISRH